MSGHTIPILIPFSGEKLVKSNDELYAEHVRTWGTVWSAGRVDVVGNLPLGQAIYGAYYYILSSMPLSEDPTSPFIGLSPSGLPFGDLGMVGNLFCVFVCPLPFSLKYRLVCTR